VAMKFLTIWAHTWFYFIHCISNLWITLQPDGQKAEKCSWYLKQTY